MPCLSCLAFGKALPAFHNTNVEVCWWHVQDRSSCVFLNLALATQQALLAGSDLEANSAMSFKVRNRIVHYTGHSDFNTGYRHLQQGLQHVFGQDQFV